MKERGRRLFFVRIGGTFPKFFLGLVIPNPPEISLIFFSGSKKFISFFFRYQNFRHRRYPSKEDLLICMRRMPSCLGRGDLFLPYGSNFNDQLIFPFDVLPARGFPMQRVFFGRLRVILWTVCQSASQSQAFLDHSGPHFRRVYIRQPSSLLSMQPSSL